jgi:hypothetical protein
MPYGAVQFGSEESSAGLSHAAWQLLGPDGEPRRAAGTVDCLGQPCLMRIEVAALALCAVCADASSAVGEVKRTVSESPYTSAVATAFRRGAIARCFQSIVLSVRAV